MRARSPAPLPVHSDRAGPAADKAEHPLWPPAYVHSIRRRDYLWRWSSAAGAAAATGWCAARRRRLRRPEFEGTVVGDRAEEAFPPV